MRILTVVLLTLVVLVALFLAWPSPIGSKRFDPGPLSPPFAPDERLASGCVRISEGEIPHSDKLLVDARGHVFAGDDRGRIHELAPDAAGAYASRVVAEPGGHPMELDFDAAGRIVGADHHGSHFRIEPDGSITRLATLVGLEEGTAGLAVASDGRLFYGAHPEGNIAGDTTGFMEMLAAHQASELRSFDPATGVEETLVSGLFRPVGVELSASEDFVAVAEFFAYRVTRYWLSGPRAGTHDRLIERLPGVPDGLASDGAGTFYVSIPGYPPGFMAALHRTPFAKDQLAKVLPWLLRMGATPQGGPGIVIAVDETGAIRATYQDPDGRVVDRVTTAELHDGALFLGSIASDWIARCPIGAP